MVITLCGGIGKKKLTVVVGQIRKKKTRSMSNCALF